MTNPPLPECIARLTKIESALEDNGSWGIKTKVAQMWDFFMKVSPSIGERDAHIKNLYEEVSKKVNIKDSIINHEKLLMDVKDLLEKREEAETKRKKLWRWWFEQLRWIMPYGAAFYMWITTRGGV